MSERDRVPEQLLSGRYKVLRQVGEGGMGAVYIARDGNLDCDVVVKMPRRGALDEPGFAERFSREIRALVELAHPHVVKIQDVGNHNGVPFCVMQHLAGGNLQERPAPAAPASLGQWLPAVADALDFVHKQGYLHRDIKPANILFDGHGNAYVSDFGVTKVLSTQTTRKGTTHLTGEGLVVGTPEYLAPELIMGQKDVDGRADQYALAMTVYRVLAGRLPFDATTPSAILVMQTMGRLLPLRAFAPNAPEAVANAVERALSKKPNKRYPDCASFARAVLQTTLPRPATKPAAGPAGPVLGPASGGRPPPPPVAARRIDPLSTPAWTPTAPIRSEAAPGATSRPPPSTRTNGAPPTAATPRAPRSSRSAAAARTHPAKRRPALFRRLLAAGAILLVLGGAVAGALAVREWQRSSKPQPSPNPREMPVAGEAAAFSFKDLAEELTLRPGEPQQVTIRVARPDYEGPIRLMCSNCPPNVVVSEAVINDGETQTTLKLEARAGAPAHVDLRLTGRGGNHVKTLVLRLRILPPAGLTAQLPPLPLPVLWIGDRAVTLRIGLVRQDCANEVAQFHIDMQNLPDGVLVTPKWGTVAVDKTIFEINLQATTQAAAGKDFTLPITVTLARPTGMLMHNVQARLYIANPPVQLGKASVVRAGEQFVVTVPIQRNGFRAPLTLAFENLPDHLSFVGKIKVSEDQAQFVLAAKKAKGRLAAKVLVFAQAGDVRLPASAQFAINVENAEK